MKRWVFIAALILASVSSYCQDTVPEKPRREVTKKKLSAEDIINYGLRITKDSLNILMTGAKRVEMQDFTTYYIYSDREKHNIPVSFYYKRYPDKKERVWKIELPSRIQDTKYKTSDLQIAFWVEWIINPY